MEITELAEFRYLSKNFADLGFKVVIKSTFHNNFWPLYWPWFQIYTFCIPIQCFFISFERKSWLFRLLYVFWGSSVENSKITESTKFRYFAPNPENKTIPLFGPSTVIKMAFKRKNGLTIRDEAKSRKRSMGNMGFIDGKRKNSLRMSHTNSRSRRSFLWSFSNSAGSISPENSQSILWRLTSKNWKNTMFMCLIFLENGFRRDPTPPRLQ